MRGDRRGMAENRCDVLVVGAGIIGLSSAYHIKQAHPELSVLIIDRGSAAGQGDTAKSNAALRDTFTSTINRTLARSTIDFYKHVQGDLGFNLNLDMVGYLWLLSGKQAVELEGVEAEMRRQGIRLRTYDMDELSAMIPDLIPQPSSQQSKLMELEGVEKGMFGIDCGTVASELIVKFYETELKKLGVEFQFHTEAKALSLGARKSLDLPGEPFGWQEKRFKQVETDRRPIFADTIVLSAGTRNPLLLDPVGVDCMIKPRKNQLFQLRGATLQRLLATKGFNEQGTIPFTILPKGQVYFRPVWREKSLWVSAHAGFGRPFGLEEEPAAEETYYNLQIYPVLSEYFPCFTNLRPASMWAGFYDVNSLDGTPIVARVENCIITAGLSGSGIMKADAVGRITAALVDNKEEVELYGDQRVSTSEVGLVNRRVEPEKFVI
jgi:glycine/D-amino acid oxidase-like deaminating enzyme